MSNKIEGDSMIDFTKMGISQNRKSITEGIQLNI